MANEQNMLRIDMSKEQTLSEGAAAYVARSEEELEAMIAQAEACIEAIASLAANPAVFEPERRICLDPQALPEALPGLFGTSAEALRDIPLDYFESQLKHVLRMSRKARDIVQNTLSVLGLELLTACQAIDIRRRLNTHGQDLSPFHQHIYDMVRREIPFYDKDRELWPDIRKAEAFIRRKDLLDLIDRYMPELLENNAWEQYRGE